MCEYWVNFKIISWFTVDYNLEREGLVFQLIAGWSVEQTFRLTLDRLEGKIV
jgi:hypothetical protein